MLQHSEAEKAGIQEGDLVLRWARGDVHGEIRSPFDLNAAEIEQAPRGNVLLEGLRGKEKRTWQLGQDRWGIDVRPNFPDAILTLYRTGEDLATAGKLSEAAEKWRLVADQGDSSNPQWLLFHLAGLQADARHWQEADRSYQEALQISAANRDAVVQIHMAWGRSFVRRNDWEHAGEHFNQAMAAERALGNDRLALAIILDELGGLAEKQGDLKKAERYYQQGLRLRDGLNPASLATSTSLNNLGALAYKRGDLDKAEELDQRALAMTEKIAPGGLTASQALGNLGNVADDRGKLAKAGEYYRRSLDLYAALEPDGLGVAKALQRLGWVAWESGDLGNAEEHYRRALSIQEKAAPDGLDVAASLNNLGLVAWQRGDLAKAEEYHRQALAIAERFTPGSMDVAKSLNNLGIVAWQRGDLARAEEYYRQALAIYERLAPGATNFGRVLNNLGIVARQRGDLARAEEYYRRALAIWERLDPGSPDLAANRNYLGLIAGERGNSAEAEKYYRQALSIYEKRAPFSVDMARNLNRLAQLLERRGALEEAEQCYRKASAILDKLAPGSVNVADSLAGLASIRRRQGRPEEAAQFYAQALDAFEAQTAHLGGATDIRADFRAKRGSYREYMEVLLAQGKPEAAFEVLERSRAQILLEILAAAHVDIGRGVSPELLKKERSLQADIKAKSERRVHLLSAKQSDEQVKAAEKEISTLTAEYQDVEAQIRSKSPAYAALTQPQPLSTKEIQQQLLDSDTVLLEYSLGEERSHVFVVSSGSLEAFDQPKRMMIEGASRRVYELLTARNRWPKGEKPADRVARIARADSEFPQAAAQLSRMVLGPVARKLANKRLLIVSDGALNYVPFAALPLKTAGQAAAPLAARHEIVNLPSASVLAVLRRERQGRPVAAKTVAVLADPVFDSRDVRVKQSLAAAGSRQNVEPTRGQAALQAVPAVSQDGAGQKDGEGKSVTEPSTGAANPSSTTHTAAIALEEPVSTSEESLDAAWLTRSAADVGWKRTDRGEVYLPRLQSTRREAEAIVTMVPAGKSFEALDFKANRATATSVELENYRTVHFATHALLDSKHPEFSGLVLSLVNERGRPQSGFLGLEDIYNLNLPAELVVLSACETALGKEMDGEGMAGLTRGFMYAGASRVVASLWNINDQATAEQMRHFYRAMLGQGMRPAAALRSAQLKLSKEARWKSPYFWAAFQIQGEWK